MITANKRFGLALGLSILFSLPAYAGLLGDEQTWSQVEKDSQARAKTSSPGEPAGTESKITSFTLNYIVTKDGHPLEENGQPVVHPIGVTYPEQILTGSNTKGQWNDSQAGKWVASCVIRSMANDKLFTEQERNQLFKSVKNIKIVEHKRAFTRPLGWLGVESWVTYDEPADPKDQTLEFDYGHETKTLALEFSPWMAAHIENFKNGKCEQQVFSKNTLYYKMLAKIAGKGQFDVEPSVVISTGAKPADSSLQDLLTGLQNKANLTVQNNPNPSGVVSVSEQSLKSATSGPVAAGASAPPATGLSRVGSSQALSSPR